MRNFIIVIALFFPTVTYATESAGVKGAGTIDGNPSAISMEVNNETAKLGFPPIYSKLDFIKHFGLCSKEHPKEVLEVIRGVTHDKSASTCLAENNTLCAKYIGVGECRMIRAVFDSSEQLEMVMVTVAGLNSIDVPYSTFKNSYGNGGTKVSNKNGYKVLNSNWFRKEKTIPLQIEVDSLESSSDKSSMIMIARNPSASQILEDEIANSHSGRKSDKWFKVSDRTIDSNANEGEDGANNVYLNPSTLRKKGNKAKILLLSDYETPQTFKNGNGRYLSQIALLEFDCHNTQERMNSFMLYTGNMGAGSVAYTYDLVKNDHAVNWSPIEPDSMLETVRNFSCGKLASPADESASVKGAGTEITESKPSTISTEINKQTTRIGLPPTYSKSDFVKNYGVCDKDPKKVIDLMRKVINVKSISTCVATNNSLCGNYIIGNSNCKLIRAVFDSTEQLQMVILSLSGYNSMQAPYTEFKKWYDSGDIKESYNNDHQLFKINWRINESVPLQIEIDGLQALHSSEERTASIIIASDPAKNR